MKTLFHSELRVARMLSCGLAVFALGACSSNENASSNAGAGGTADVGGNTSTPVTGGTSNPGTNEQMSTVSTGGNGGSTSANNVGGTSGSTAVAAGGSGGSSDGALTPDSPLSGKLVINELCPSNRTGAMEGGSYPDWAELYNSSTEDISLKGFFITDDNAQPTKFALTKDTLVVKAGGYLILWPDGDDTETDFHLSFSLSAAGETLTLLDTELKVVDSVAWTNAEIDKAYARLPDGTGAFSWCNSGTPNRANGAACP